MIKDILNLGYVINDGDTFEKVIDNNKKFVLDIVVGRQVIITLNLLGVNKKSLINTSIRHLVTIDIDIIEMIEYLEKLIVELIDYKDGGYNG